MKSTDLIGVFGANGFIGRHLIRKLSHVGLKSIAFGRQFPDDFYKVVGMDVETRRIDITNELETAVMLQDITHVVQLINTSNPAMGNLHLFSDLMLNVAPNVRFIESCIATDVQKFIFISSGGTVYGVPKHKPIPENHPTEPLNSYGLGKLTVEHYLSMLSRGTDLSFTTLRVSNPFGPGQTNKKGQGLIPAVLKQFAVGEPVKIFGDGQSERDYIYIDDVVEAIVASLHTEGLNGAVNIGSGYGRTVIEVVEAIERVLKRGIDRHFVEARPTDTPSNVLDISKAKALLGWTPRTDFHDGIRLTVNAYPFDDGND